MSFLLSLFVFFQAKAGQASEQPALVLDSGGVKVYAIEDSPGSMDISLFRGPASPEQRSAYFKDGKVPSSINVFLIKKEDRCSLIDTGFGVFGPGHSALMERLADIGLTPDKIDAVLLTHMHMDHIGGLLKDGKRLFPNAGIYVAKAELDYWLSRAAREPGNPNARLAQSVAETYGRDIAPPFTPGTEIQPGVTALDAAGHTPGHTVFHIRAGDKELLIVGDLLHAAALQFPLPEECPSYDMDVPAAIKSRKRILDMAAEKGIPVAGMHIPFAGAGTVNKAGAGYAFTPMR
jgi:glyoxylase-like metal-dependent hydrolase (beta-lactamase superfamily II)